MSLDERVAELEKELAARKEQEAFLHRCEEERYKIRMCGKRGHNWKADDNLGWFYTCRSCGLLWNSMRRGQRP